jgi:hypothetical protein
VTAPGLEESDALLVLNVGGLDDGSALQLYARHVYSCASSILKLPGRSN